MDLVVNVEEGSTANINFGVTFSGGDYPISGLLKWSENNFLGRGDTVGVNLEISNLRQLVSLSFSEPWLFGKRWLGGVSLNFEHAVVRNVLEDMLFPRFNGDEAEAFPDYYDTYADYQAAINNGDNVPSQYTMDYTVWKMSLGLDTGYRYFTPLGWLGVRSGVSLGFERIEYNSILHRPFDPDVRAGEGVWKNVNKLGVTLYWDKRDYFLNPSKGFYLAQGATFALGLPIGSRDFIRTDSTAEGFLTLVEKQAGEKWKFRLVLAAHSALSFILPEFWNAATGPTAITTDMLYIDGWNIARGWPLVQDLKALWDNRLELRMPISEQLLWAVLFMDVVAGYPEIQDMSPLDIDSFYFSFGGGIRFSIPQFPIRLYLATRFKTENGRVAWQAGDLPIFGTGLDFVISIGGDTF
jgi:outer membrane protein insertion porin family